MAVKILIKRGLENDRSGYTPDNGELIVTTDTKRLYIGDGVTAGGSPVGGSSGGIVANETAMLSVNGAQRGDMVYREDLEHIFVLVGNDASVLANWVDSDLVDASTVGLDMVENYGISDSVVDDNSTQYASSAAAFTANARAVQAETTSIAYADQVKSDLLGGTPSEQLDTLTELGEALTDNESAIVAINASLATKVEQSDYNTFVARTDNPHAVTKEQVGLGSVENYTISDSTSDAVSTQYASSAAVKSAYDLATSAKTQSNDALGLEGQSLSQVIAAAQSGLATSVELQAHATDTNNPHAVTKEQVGLGNVQDYGISDAVDSVASGQYASSLAVKTAYDVAAAAATQLAFDAWIARTDNPHAVTKDQVGLGSVENYGVSDAVDSALSTQYASSAAVKTAYDLASSAKAQADDSLALEGNSLADVLASARTGLATQADFDTFVTRTDNPHAVTKAQVGLGSVENADIATILASDAVTQPVNTNNAKIATTGFVVTEINSQLATQNVLMDGDTLDGGTFSA